MHTDWLGTQDIFTRSIGRTTYWANRLTPLVEFSTSPVHADATAWRMCMILSGFWAGSTPFVEITRLDAGQSLRLERGELRLTTELPSWFTNPQGAASVDDLAAAIEGAVPRSLLNRSDLTLSGGLDSRLILAAGLHRGGPRPRSFSTHHESGWDGDTRIAEEVARAARLDHRLIDYGPDDWLNAREKTLDRLEHSTSMHAWLLPLARTIHNGRAARAPLLDGLAGDVLMKYHDEVAPVDRDERTRRVWATLGANGFSASIGLRPDIRDEWESEAQAAWRQQMRRWDDHPYAETVMRLLTRTRRAIAASPFRLFAPERRVLTPFIDPDVVRVALSVPPLASSDRDLRPRVLRVLDPALADINSTVDPAVNQGAFVERGPSSPAAVWSMVRAIDAEPSSARLFNDGALASVSARAGARSIPQSVRRAAMLAHWTGRWRTKLAQPLRFD
ncbi:asparagine synthase C-terminal domain-containing protein [Microbacterium sp. 2FI]|uniref:asparagine synthase-related protein n=1 Tax=Microbacterium sp. 2FI TaxID=2502193 RepID=UPI0010F4BA10|nr:asparagine synthase C-terminal domain-containing protein [Microbacterium sp. 2FI]